MLEKMVQGIEKFVYPSSRIAAYVGVAMLVALVVIPLVDIAMRRLVNKPLSGAYELSEFALGLMVFTTLAYCAVRGVHIVVDIATSQLPKRAQKVLDVFILSISWFIMGITSWRLILRAFLLKDDNDISTILYIPTYPFVLIAGIGCALLTLVFFVQSLDKLLRR